MSLPIYSTTPILPTTIVGSYSMPGWLERLKTEYFARRIRRQDLEEAYDSVAKAAIKDQEVAGLDIVTDGESQRDNMVDYFVERMAGVEIDRTSKKYYYDFYTSTVNAKLPVAPLGLVGDFKLLQNFTERGRKICITGPHHLAKKIVNEHYGSEAEFAAELGRVLNPELKALAAAGANYIQIDEPSYSGFPDDLPWAIDALNIMTAGVDAKIALHICYGNRYGKPTWEGSYEYLFPAILRAKVQQLTLEFARRGGQDLHLFKHNAHPFELGVGVIDVKNPEIETPEIVAGHIRKALAVMPAERLFVLPDCGCFHLQREIAFAKLQAMVAGAKIIRKELGK